MDPMLNPYRPGAGAVPPALAGRQSEVNAMDLIIAKSRQRRNDGPLIMYGLRGVGKTVLLGELRRRAERANWIVVALEARPGDSGKTYARRALGSGLALAARRMRAFKHARATVADALRTVTSFTVSIAGVSIATGIAPDPTRANSGNLEIDLEELVTDLAPALRANQSGLGLFVDELQDLDEDLLIALLAVQHKAIQEDWPFHLIGTGLATLVRRLAGARSYSERFDVRAVDALTATEATQALVQPAAMLGVEFAPGSIEPVLDASGGYPFFLQTYGKAMWDLAPSATIDRAVADAAIIEGNADLDAGFFPARWDRTTPRERDYLRAIAELGGDEAQTSAIADHLGTTGQALSVPRSELINKGILYAPRRGIVDFTVPNMAGFIRRNPSFGETD